MPANVLLPQWGMGMNEGQVVKWLKSEGGGVAKGDALVEIESTKVNAEVEATADGTLGRIAVGEGETVPVGTVLGYLLLEGETAADLPEVAPKPSAGAKADDSPAGSGRPQRGRRSGGKVVATPRARRLARQLEVDLDSISLGTGPGGRITEDDVRTASEGGGSGPASADSAVGAEPSERVPLTGMRRVIARRMMESASAALVTLHAKTDVTAAVAMQRQLVRAWRRDRVRPQYQDLVIAATVRALRQHPVANAHLVGDEILRYDQINLGFALAVPDGLLVPVIRDAGSKSPLDLAREVRELARQAKSGGLGAKAVTGSTFSLTNLGSYDVTNFTPLINPPEIGILGVGSVEQELRLDADGNVVTRSVGYFSLTFDHRAWDGAPAGEFLASITSGLSSPDWMLGE